MSNFTVVIPTLNENGTIAQLCLELLERYPGVCIIVADDGSNDGTQETVWALSKKHHEIRLLDRSRARTHGLTASVLDAAQKAKTEYIVVMDGDLQHPPEAVGKIVRELEQGHDLVVGYRTAVAGWGVYRKVMSKTAELLGGAVLWARGAPSCKDIMSGFFGVKRKLLVGAYEKNPDAFELRGYKVLLDLLKLMPRNARIANVGYEFGMRRTGKSKIGVKQVVLYLRSLLR